QWIGLHGGWMSLTRGGPFTRSAGDAHYPYQHGRILLTEGRNTENLWYSSQTSSDNRHAMSSTHHRAPRASLSTIPVHTTGDPLSTLLQPCATVSTKFFLPTSASSIVTHSAQISTNATKLQTRDWRAPMDGARAAHTPAP